MRQLGVAVWLLTLFFGAVCLPASAAPAMWVIHGPNSTVYLFGTIHVMKADTAWRTPAFDKAFSESSEFWLELGKERDTEEEKAVVRRLGFDRDHPLSSRLSFNEIARIDAIARGAGITGGAFAIDPMRPWLASLTLSRGPGRRVGYRKGVEEQLEAAAQAAGKPVFGLETFESHIRVFSDLPEPVQNAMLAATLDNLSRSSATLDSLIAVWLKGDDIGLDRLENNIRVKSPELYRSLLVDRNVRFADRISVMVKGTGTRMVAIGAAHFVGADSVIAMLAQKGIVAERVFGALSPL